MLADVDLDRAQASAQTLREEGHAASAVKCDVRSREQIDAAVQAAVDQFGGLDIAVANAGGVPGTHATQIWVWVVGQCDSVCVWSTEEPSLPV